MGLPGSEPIKNPNKHHTQWCGCGTLRMLTMSTRGPKSARTMQSGRHLRVEPLDSNQAITAPPSTPRPSRYSKWPNRSKIKSPGEIL
ncbi:unnamed protein product, partial [Iphiclides podalirius]